MGADMKDQPAFPLNTPQWHESVSDNGFPGIDFTMGMTLRDYFAGQALAGGLEQGVEDDMNSGWWHDPSKIAKRAYAVADAMMKARDDD